MRPKIEAGIDFVRRSHHENPVAIIAHVDQLADALDGKSGTRIVRFRIFDRITGLQNDQQEIRLLFYPVDPAILLSCQK